MENYSKKEIDSMFEKLGKQLKSDFDKTKSMLKNHDIIVRALEIAVVHGDAKLKEDLNNAAEQIRQEKKGFEQNMGDQFWA